MLQTVESRESVGSTLRDDYLKAFRLMLLSRVLDEKLASLYRGGKIHGGVFLGKGQEALSVALGLALRKGDVYAPCFIRVMEQGARLRTGADLSLTPCGKPDLPWFGSWTDAWSRWQCSSRSAA